MQFKIISIGSKFENTRVAEVVNAQSSQGKCIQCCITETATDLHLITTNFYGSPIPSTYIRSHKDLDSLEVGDIIIMDE